MVSHFKTTEIIGIDGFVFEANKLLTFEIAQCKVFHKNCAAPLSILKLKLFHRTLLSTVKPCMITKFSFNRI